MRIFSYRVFMICSYLYTLLSIFTVTFLKRSVSPLLFFGATIVLLLIGVLQIQIRNQKVENPHRTTVKVQSRIMIIVLVTMLIVAGFYDSEQFQIGLNQTAGYLLIFITTVTLFHRSLMVEEHQIGKKDYYRLQRVELLGFYAVSLFIFVIQLPQRILWVLLKGVVVILGKLAILFPKMQSLDALNGFNEKLSGYQVQQSDRSFLETLEKEYEKKGMKPLKVTPQTVSVEPLDLEQLKNFLYIAGILFLLIFTVLYLIYIFSKPQKKADTPDLKEEHEKMQIQKKQTKITRFTRDEGIQIRSYYQSFLKECRKKHIPWSLSDTTASMQSKYIEQEEAKTGAQIKDLKRFTQIYRNARYNTEQSNLEKDSREAKKLFRGLLKE